MRSHFLRQGLRWSEGDLRRLRALAARGEPLAVIATRLGRTVEAVQWQADKRGIALRRATPARGTLAPLRAMPVSAPS